MPGLLAELDALSLSIDIDAQIEAPAAELRQVITLVNQLVAGPPELDQMRAAIGSVPLPPALEGLASLGADIAGSVEGRFPDDVRPLLRPLLAPLLDLAAGGLRAGATVRVTGIVEVVRELMRLTTGRVFGGPQGMPDGPEGGPQSFTAPPMPDIAELRAGIAEARAVLEGLGPRIDASRVIELLRRASGGFATPLRRWPPLPLVGELMEELATVEAWQRMTAPQLTASLRRTLEMTAALVASPRERVAAPAIAGAATLAGGGAMLAAAEAELAAVFATVRPKVLAGTGQATTTELVRLEAQAEALEGLAHALDVDAGPLAAVDALPDALTEQLLTVLRTLQPAHDVTPLVERVRQLVAELPAAEAEPLADVEQAIRDFDLSVLSAPLAAVRDAVQEAVDQVEAAKAEVRDALIAALQPVADALDAALAAARLDEIREALEGVPAALDAFVDDELRSSAAGLRDAVGTAVGAVSETADSFDPGVIVEPLRAALEQASDVLRSSEVTRAFDEVEEALETAIRAIESFDLSGAADEAVGLMGQIETRLADIDSALIPDEVKPIIAQAVEVVTRIEFTTEIAAPVLDKIEQAARTGPDMVLRTLEGSMDEVRVRVEGFRPSQAIGEALDRPFRELTSTLRQFSPRELLGRLQEALDGIAAGVGVLDVEAVIAPVAEVHAELAAQVERLRPSALLRPVEEAVEAAVAEIYGAVGLDDVFGGLAEVLAQIEALLGLLGDTRDLLAQAADLLEDPGDAEAEAEALVAAAVARLDDADMAALAPAFAAVADAVRATERNALAADLARSLQAAGDRVPAMLASPAAGRVKALIRAFPDRELRQGRDRPSQRRLVAVMDRLLAVAAALDAAPPRWAMAAPRLQLYAGSIQERLLPYHQLLIGEGAGVLDSFARPPATTAALRAAVEEALRDGLAQPLRLVVEVFRRLAPHVGAHGRGVAAVMDAIHAKMDEVVGAGGIAGAVGAVEEVADLLRDIDMTPVSDPLDALHGRITEAVEALDPAPLRAVLEAARDAIGDLLTVTTIVDPADADQLDAAYAAAVDKIEGLAPAAIVSATLDPVYEELLADVLRVLELPKRLRALLQAAGADLTAEAKIQLARVEEAFDRMLRAIPLQTGARQASASVSVSVGVG
jgi:molecular chaperone GrpE (heat shock protein)